MYKKYFAELLGTFTLTLVVILSISGVFPIPTPIMAAVTLGLFVYSISHISGAHLNPAVTLGLWTIKKINTGDAFSYILAQFVGATLAFVIALFLGNKLELVPENIVSAGIAEMAGMVIFTFGIASVVFGNIHKATSGLMIGGSLFLGISVAVLMGSNGVLNPAVAVGIGSFNLVYLLGPIIGSIIGMKLYEIIDSKK